MKNFFKRPRTYLLLIIILIPIIAFAVLFSNYYSIYKSLNLTGSSAHTAHNSGTDATTGNPVTNPVKNPFEDINTTEENKESMEENKNLIEEGATPFSGIIDDEETDFSEKTEKTEEPGKPSYNYIVGKYKNKFEELQQAQENRLFSLVEEAKTEYIKGGSKRSSILIIGYKYLGRVNKLEQQSNKKFDNLIDDLKTELTDNSYKTDIIQELKDYYVYYKKSLKSEIIKSAKECL